MSYKIPTQAWLAFCVERRRVLPTSRGILICFVTLSEHVSDGVRHSVVVVHHFSEAFGCS